MRLTLIITCTLLALSGCASSPDKTDDRGARCPEGRAFDDMFCSKIPRYARDPDTGQCCRYDSPCATPTGWETYPTEKACEAAPDD